MTSRGGAPRKEYSYGTRDLRGVLGLANVQISRVSDLGWSEDVLKTLALKPRRILLHYLTEPPKCNFVEVTTFLDGRILGLDLMRSEHEFRLCYSVVRHKTDPEVREDDQGEIKVYDASEIIGITRSYLRDRPFRGGEMLVEAHSEKYLEPRSRYSSHEDVGCRRRRRAYGVMAIGKPVDPGQNYLLMEDTGETDQDMDRVLRSMVLSVVGCEKIENMQRKVYGGEPTRYDTIYLVHDSREISDQDEGWVQVQMIYCAMPRALRRAKRAK